VTASQAQRPKLQRGEIAIRNGYARCFAGPIRLYFL